MKITSKGQVTIPLHIRRKLDLHADTEVEFEVDGNTARIRKLRGARGRTLVSQLRGRATTRLSTDEILALTRG